MTPALTILTGFLGSGKTTLLRALLERGAGGRRVALIVNELGQIGLDGATLERASRTPLVELTGGCVCCEAGSDFLFAVEELIDVADPDQIVIETTGLAEPGGMIRRARAAGLPLDAVVAVADALNLEAALRASPVTGWQLRAADIVVLSKVDQASAAERAAAATRVRALNARAAIIQAAHGDVEPTLLFGPRGNNSDPLPVLDHLAQDGFASVVWTSNQPLRRKALEATLGALPAEVYRAKGLLHCTDAPWPDELHLVCGRHTLTAVRLRAPAEPLNQVVLLGPRIGEHAAALVASLDGCADSPTRATDWLARYRATFE